MELNEDIHLNIWRITVLEEALENITKTQLIG